jgi:hypothetical protein
MIDADIFLDIVEDIRKEAFSRDIRLGVNSLADMPAKILEGLN